MKNTYATYADACIEGLQQWYNWDTGLWNSAGWWNGANALEAVIDYAALTKTDHFVHILVHAYGTLSSISAPYKQFITKNADALWERNRINNNKFGLNWAARAHITNAATQTSALDAFNAAMAVYRL